MLPPGPGIHLARADDNPLKHKDEAVLEESKKV
jgi:hypothetical protein